MGLRYAVCKADAANAILGAAKLMYAGLAEPAKGRAKLSYIFIVVCLMKMWCRDIMVAGNEHGILANK